MLGHNYVERGAFAVAVAFLSAAAFAGETTDINQERQPEVTWEIPEQDASEAWRVDESVSESSEDEAEQRRWEEAPEPGQQAWETEPEAEEAE